MRRSDRVLYGLDEPEWLAGLIRQADAHGVQAGGEDEWTITAIQAELNVSTYKSRVLRNALRRRAGDPMGWHPSQRDALDDEPAPRAAPEASTHDVDAPDEDPDRGYDYDIDGDRYVIHMPGRTHPLVMYASEVKQVHRDYSRLGNNATINQVARAHGLSRREAWGVLKAFGVTHDSLPFTAEELEGKDDDELVRDALALKQQRVERAIVRETHRQNEKLAKLWRTARHRIVEPIAQAAAELAGCYQPPRLRVAASTKRRRWMLAVSPTDLHFGKHGWSAFGPGAYDRETCRERLMGALEVLLDDLSDYGPPECILAPVGSDWFHVDGFKGTTSRGTPQDMDGVPEQIWEEGAALALDVFTALRQIAPLKVVLQAGNHDELLSRALFTVVQQYFRDDDGVTFGAGRGPYEFVEYGENLIGVTHGTGLSKASDLGPRMATHAREAWGRTRFRYWLTGNLHHHTVHSAAGVRVFLMPSLAGADRYHTTEGYDLEVPELMAIGFDYHSGHRVSFHVPMPTD